MSLCQITLFCLFLLVMNGVFGDTEEMKTVSVMEGDSVTLHTNFTDILRDDQILWMFGPQETRIAEIYKQNIDMFESSKTFGDWRLLLNNQTGSLTIRNIRTTDSGDYKLQIRSNRGNSDKRFSVTVYARLPIPKISRGSPQCSSSSSSCVLLCSVMNVTHVTLSWYKGNSLFSSISVSDLNIRLSLPLEVEYQDTNTYSCVLNNPIRNQTQHLNISDVCQSCSGWISQFLAAFIATVILTVLAGVMFLLYRRHKQAGQKGFNPCGHVVETVQTEEEEIHYADTTFCRQNEQKKKVNGTEEIIYSTVHV